MRLSRVIFAALFATLTLCQVTGDPGNGNSGGNGNGNGNGNGKPAKPLPTTQQHPGTHNETLYQYMDNDDDFVPGKNASNPNAPQNDPQKGGNAPNKVQTKFQINTNTIHIESQTHIKNQKDMLNINLENNDDEVELALQQSNHTVVPGMSNTKGDFKFTIRFLSVIQYVETTTALQNETVTVLVDTGLDVNRFQNRTVTKLVGAPVQNGFQKNDTLCNEVPITGRGLIISPVGTQMIGNQTITSFNATTADGIFTLILHLTGSSNGINNNVSTYYKDGRLVVPTSVKFDVQLNLAKYPRNNTCMNSQYAIRAITRSQQNIFQVLTPNNDPPSAAQYAAINDQGHFPAEVLRIKGIQTGGAASPIGFFKWAPTAAVNGGPNVTNVIIGSFQGIVNYYDNDTTQYRSNGEDGRSDYHTKYHGDEANDLNVVNQAIYSFAAINPTTITWDPEIGVDTTPIDGTTTATDIPTDAPTGTTPTGTGSTPSASSSTGKSENNVNTGITTSLSLVTIITIALLSFIL